MGKSPEAFRTISEVADWLGIQAHVLRFWESKFSQVKPVKRAGGRRYYRPNDMLLLGGIKKLLYEDGLTIKGAQKVLREAGIAHVVAMSPPLDDETAAQLDAPEEAAIVEDVPQETGVVLSFENGRPDDGKLPIPAPPEPSPPAVASPPSPPRVVAEEEPAPAEPEVSVTEAKATPPEPSPAEEPAPASAEPETTAADVTAEVEATPAPVPEDDDKGEGEAAASLPAFLRRPMADTPPPADNPPPADAAPPPSPPAPKPRMIDMPVLTPLDQIDAKPGVLTAAARVQSLSAEQAKHMTPLLARLTVLRDSMAAPRRQGPGPGTAD